MTSLRLAGRLDPEPLRKAVAEHAADFGLYTFRQDSRGTPHVDTETLFLRMPPVISQQTIFEGLDCRDWPLMTDPVFRAYVGWIANIAGSKAARAMIVKLKPGGRITRHVDQGAYADATDRYHFAIETNADCRMQIGEDTVHAAEGTLWFFDKHAEHSVVNEGATDRLHLIVDVWRDPTFVYRPTITYQEECFNAVKHETTELVQEHWREITDDTNNPIDLDWEWYARAEDLDLIRAFTVRADGVLVGYIVFLLMTLPHYKTYLVAADDAFFLKKEYRTGTVGVRMFREAEKMLTKYGVQRVMYHEKLKVPVGKVFKYLGYRPVETIWWKELSTANVKMMPRPKIGSRQRPLKRIFTSA